jgi:hypothetical protein
MVKMIALARLAARAASICNFTRTCHAPMLGALTRAGFGVSTYGPEKGLRIMEGLGLVEVT